MNLDASTGVAGAVALPDCMGDVLPILGVALGVLVLLWLVASVIASSHRKAYNLTKAETSGPEGGTQPGFLTVDAAKRAEQIRRGDEYVRPSDRMSPTQVDAPPLHGPPAWATFAVLARIAAGLVAVAHVGALAISLWIQGPDSEHVWRDLTASERVAAILARYWVGFALAGLVIAGEVMRWVRRRQARARGG